MSDTILSIRGLRKTYGTGVDALKSVDLDIRRGEIFALLGPNGAGKTTLINIVCGIVTPSDGEVLVDGRNWQSDYRYARERIGLVPQELTTEAFEPVWNTVSFSRGLFGKPRNDAFIEELLKRLSLWDKRKTIMMHLSGGMKRRVMIAKALSHEPALLFLDEPTAGVDVELRRDMWDLVRKLRADGTTIILTTHYIEEAEEMADRVGVISKGELIAVDEKTSLMAKMGKKTLDIMLAEPLKSVPSGLSDWNIELSDDGHMLRYQFDSHAERTGIASLMRRLSGSRHRLQGPVDPPVEPRGDLRRARPRRRPVNFHGISAIYRFEMARWKRTLWQSLITPVITTALYFVVFGSALGSRMTSMDGVSFGAFIVPGLTLLSVFMQSIFNASFGIYFPKFTGTIYELLSAPISSFEAVLAYVGAAVTKSVILALVTIATATLFVPVHVDHPIAMILFLVGISAGFCLFGFAIGVWAQNFEQLQIIPMLIITPLTFLGGAFYSVKALHDPFRTITLFNPIVHVISGFRWSFYSVADVPVWSSVLVTVAIIAGCMAVIAWMFRTGYRLKQ